MRTNFCAIVVAVITLGVSALVHSEQVVADDTNQAPVADSSLQVVDAAAQPVVTVTKLPAGVQQVEVVTQLKGGGSKRVEVKVDPHGNKETMIITTSADGQKQVSVLGSNSQVEVEDTPQVVIGEDGTLVAASTESNSTAS